MRSTTRLQTRIDSFFAMIDYWMLIPVLIIAVMGLVVLNTVLASGYGAAEYPMNFYKQLGAVFVGVALALIICLFDSPTLRLFGIIVFGISLLLLVYIKVDGYSLKAITGADSWMQLPIVGSYQPSELAKLGIIMVSAYSFAAMREGKITYVHGAINIGLTFLVPLGLILLEPDFGTGMVIIFTFISMLFVWGIKWRYILLGLAGVVVTVPLLWMYVFSPYQQNRILTFVFPGHDKTASYHIGQSLAAIASGGLTGVGDGPRVAVPVKESDFIYTALSENMGLIGTTALIILVTLFIVRTIIVAVRVYRYGNRAEAYILIGAIAFFSAHFIENLGMSVGLLPITGIPLPFFSYGGSAMVTSFITLGVMLNISMNHKVLMAETASG
ncbi:MAG TPA: FtsW/RodA/SpoVE family cell cycle protein [Fastidiosipila sp.]|jgi:rod shape determining protein RodA|nr:FtsW/RodA/SpoVE family cell cycle protein [Fastidiosipila sp.]